MRIVILILSLLLLLAVLPAGGADLGPRKPGPGDKCPVCGMFVSKYPDFACQIIFKDGTALFFDGAKDFFKYYQGLSAPGSRKKAADVVAIFVTNYYTLTPMDGRAAWYVTESDVYGPMGRELVPFASEAEAREFQTDHKGKAVLRFSAVTPSVVRALDR